MCQFFKQEDIIELMSEIQNKREEMLLLANKFGHTDGVTIKCSQELDELIYQYQRLTQTKMEAKRKTLFCQLMKKYLYSGTVMLL